MSGTFAFVHALTAGQAVEYHVQEIKCHYFTVDPHRIVAEPLSGSARPRIGPGF